MMKTAVLVFLIGYVSCDVDLEITLKEDHNSVCSDKVDDLTKKVNDLMDKMKQLDATKGSEIAKLRDKIKEMEAANLIDKMTHVEEKLNSTDKEVVELQRITQGGPKVAFSVALLKTGSETIGPFKASTSLKYKKIFSNFGDCYSPATGMFTAKVKGVYFFRFSMFNNLQPTPSSVVSLMKNNEQLVSVWDTSGSDANDMGSNAAVVPLEVNDTVYVKLWANRQIYDDGMSYNTFTGFLLFIN